MERSKGAGTRSAPPNLTQRRRRAVALSDTRAPHARHDESQPVYVSLSLSLCVLRVYDIACVILIEIFTGRLRYTKLKLKMEERESVREVYK